MKNQNQPSVNELSEEALNEALDEISGEPLAAAVEEDQATMMLSASELEAIDPFILDKVMEDQDFVELIKRGANLTLLKALTNYSESVIRGFITKAYAYITLEDMGHPISEEESSKKIVNIGLARICSLSQFQAHAMRKNNRK